MHARHEHRAHKLLLVETVKVNHRANRMECRKDVGQDACSIDDITIHAHTHTHTYGDIERTAKRRRRGERGLRYAIAEIDTHSDVTNGVGVFQSHGDGRTCCKCHRYPWTALEAREASTSRPHVAL